MKTTIVNVVLAGFISVAALGFIGCADTADNSYTPPITARQTTTTQEYITTQPATQVVDVPTRVTTMVPVTANATTTTTQLNQRNGREAHDHRSRTPHTRRLELRMRQRS